MNDSFKKEIQAARDELEKWPKELRESVRREGIDRRIGLGTATNSSAESVSSPSSNVRQAQDHQAAVTTAQDKA